MSAIGLQLSLFDTPRIVGDSSSPYLREQLITYIGNKRTLLEFIGKGVAEVMNRLGRQQLSCWDVFAGSGAVSRYLKQFSSSLIATDLEKYSQVVNECYLRNRSKVDEERLSAIITEINERARREPRPGFIRELYSPADDQNIQQGERAFYTNANAIFIDTVRQLIEEYCNDGLPPSLLLAPLLYSASVHANTSGVFKGFYKNSKTGVGQFGGNGKDALTRIMKPFDLLRPIFSDSECPVQVIRGDANHLAKEMPTVDLAYIDPPYNQHPYGSNYFMLNLIVDYQKPGEISRVSGIPNDWNRSAYNKRPKALAAFADLVGSINARYMLISFNSEGFISNKQMLELLGEVGRVESLETKYNTFRGSRNLNGRDIHVTEYLYLVEKG